MRGAFPNGKRWVATAMAVVWTLHLIGTTAQAYTLSRTVADKRNSANNALGACPQLNRFDLAKVIDRQWSPTLGANIHTSGSGAARTAEVEQSILKSFDVWTNVSGVALRPTSLAGLVPYTPPAGQSPCSSSDGLNTICFAQSAMFSAGVLAFTNTVTSDILGEQFPPTALPSAFTGEILDADVLFNPNVSFSTPSALPANPFSFDLESVLMHELGHFFGFGHSGVWGAMMFPFAPPAGTFNGSRPTLAAPDAPLSDDDRAGLRVLYPDPSDTLHLGSIRGQIFPANPLSLAGQSGVTGVFGAHVVAVDHATGAVATSTLGGWSCSGMGPVVFDGGYAIERLPVGRDYRIFVEPLDGPVTAGSVAGSTSALCRNATTDPGWPAQFACTVPPVNTAFTTRSRGQ